MIKSLFLLLLFTLLAFADDKSRLLALYKQKDYLKACDLGISKFSKNRNDETFISIYAYSCLNSDLIDRLATPIVMLKLTKEGRANGAYLSAILMKKKLLQHALADGYNIQGIKLPASSHILSKVFDLLTVYKGQAKNGIYTLKDDKNSAIVYRTYMQYKGRSPKIIIEQYQDGILKERHQYK